MIGYDPALVETVGQFLRLRRPNLAALDTLARCLDGAEPGVELVADLATGVGKTYIAGALLDYLAESGVRNVVIVTPGSTIQRKTVDNLTPGHPKYLHGLRCRPKVITLDDLENGSVAAALEDPDEFKVYVLTVQSLLRPDTKDARRAHRPHETLGVALYEHLQRCDDLVVIADEHHVYYSGSAKRFQDAIDALAPLALIGLTATPHERSESKVVYRYPLAEAIADGFVKIPVLVARRDGLADLRTMLADGLALLDAKAAAVAAWCRQSRKTPVRPVFFIVTQGIDEANEIRDLLAGPDLLGDAEQVLVVTSDEPDSTLVKLAAIEDPASPVRVVVSVSMLSEGWDVKNIYVIAAVRAMESKLLTEQILGRGLRLPFEERTGVAMLDTVEVLSHHKFSELLRNAKVLLEATLGERAATARAVVDPVPGIRRPTVPVTGPDDTDANLTGVDGVLDAAGSVRIELPGHVPADADQLDLFPDDDVADDAAGGGDDAQTHVGMGLSTVDARLDEATAATATLSTRLLPRTPPGVRIPLFLPRVVTRWERDPFSLAEVDLVDVEALGRRFADDEGATLDRKALDAARSGDGSVEIVIYDETDPVVASQPRMPFDTITTDLATRLLRTNGVAGTVREANAAMAVAEAFLTGAEVSEQTPWRAEHGRLATARLVEWIAGQRSARPAREVKEVLQVRWPDPAERVETRPPADRQLVTGSREFTRGYPYSGWVRGIYAVNSFDAYSTEFRLAALFDTSAGIRAWVRIDETVPLRITYLLGAVQRDYEADFVVIDDAGVHWIVEGKADSEMTNPVVIAKRDAARAWVATVNASPNVTDTWGYILASESVIAAASSWSALKTGAGTYTR